MSNVTSLWRTEVSPVPSSHSQPNLTTSSCSASIEQEPPQQANCCVTGCKTAHVCNDAQACGRVTKIDSLIKC